MCSTGSSCGQQVSTLIILLECQTVMHYLMPVVQLYIFLAQWRLVLSESAVYMFSYYHLLLSLLPWQWFSFTLTLNHKIHELFYLWCQTNLKLQENCAINARAANHLKTAVIVTFLARSLALHRTAEPQEALWHGACREGNSKYMGTQSCQLYLLCFCENLNYNDYLTISNFWIRK